jgi:hypothetical protein
MLSLGAGAAARNSLFRHRLASEIAGWNRDSKREPAQITRAAPDRPACPRAVRRKLCVAGGPIEPLLRLQALGYFAMRIEAVTTV